MEPGAGLVVIGPAKDGGKRPHVTREVCSPPCLAQALIIEASAMAVRGYQRQAQAAVVEPEPAKRRRFRRG